MADPRRPLLILVATALVLLSSAGPARAAETPAPPSHLAAYNLAWLAYLDPQDIPATRYAVCVVDTGVAITPDTPADNPNGPILRRLAVDGGSGEPEGNAPFQLHGTRMAMAAVAPQNDWGTIGTWPGGGVIGIRATTNDELLITTAAYERSVFPCIKQRQHFSVAAIVWSLNCSACSATGDDALYMEDSIVSAHQREISVVAAAGNAAGANSQFPADQPGVFSVASGSRTGALCADASFDESVAVIGPGCPVETGDPVTGAPQAFEDGGSSTAAVVTATLIAALRSMRPDAEFEQVEQWVRESARLVDGNRVLDGAAAARLAGLGPVLERAIARMPPPPIDSSTTSAAFEPTQVGGSPSSTTTGIVLRRLPRPTTVSARCRRGRLRISAAGRPNQAVLEVSIRKGRRGRTRRVTRRSDRVIMRIHACPRYVTLRYIPSIGTYDQASPSVRLERRSAGRFVQHVGAPR